MKIRDAVNTILAIDPRTEHKSRNCRWRASSLGKCKRIQMLEALGYKTTFTKENALMMRMGTEVHNILQAEIMKQFPSATIEVALDNPDINISGTADTLLDLEEE